MNTSASLTHTRHRGFDLLRVIAIYMVMQIHTGEFEYIAPDGTVLHTPGSWAVGWTNSLLRVCVPLFVMITGFFLFPVENERKFFRKRFSRVLIPFLIWCAAYSFYYYAQGTISLQNALLNIAKIPVNYGTEVGHLWFVYMLMAIYLIAPVLSPWIVSASRKSMELFLGLWGVTLLLPYIHLFSAVWGECYWNATPTLYYFSGFIGYAVLAAYIKRFWMAPSLRIDWLAIGMILVGYFATLAGFLYKLGYEHEVKNLELTWNFTTLNVAVMTAGLFLLFRNLHANRSSSHRSWRLIGDLSRMSYGMYLAHIIVLNAVHSRLAPLLANAFLRIPTIALTTFVITYFAVKLMSLLPGNKYLIG